MFFILQASGFDLPLPPKKMFGNMDGAFIQERKAGLQVKESRFCLKFYYS